MERRLLDSPEEESEAGHTWTTQIDEEPDNDADAAATNSNIFEVVELEPPSFSMPLSRSIRYHDFDEGTTKPMSTRRRVCIVVFIIAFIALFVVTPRYL